MSASLSSSALPPSPVAPAASAAPAASVWSTAFGRAREEAKRLTFEERQLELLQEILEAIKAAGLPTGSAAVAPGTGGEGAAGASGVAGEGGEGGEVEGEAAGEGEGEGSGAAGSPGA